MNEQEHAFPHMATVSDMVLKPTLFKSIGLVTNNKETIKIVFK